MVRWYNRISGDIDSDIDIFQNGLDINILKLVLIDCYFSKVPIFHIDILNRASFGGT